MQQQGVPGIFQVAKRDGTCLLIVEEEAASLGPRLDSQSHRGGGQPVTGHRMFLGRPEERRDVRTIWKTFLLNLSALAFDLWECGALGWCLMPLTRRYMLKALFKYSPPLSECSAFTCFPSCVSTDAT